MLIKFPRGKLYLNKPINWFILTNILNPDSTNGKDVKTFEKAFAKYLNAEYATATASGKLSLYLCLKALGAKEGDEIILSAYNVPEIIPVIKKFGLKPIFIDINPKTFNINEKLIKKKISKKTRFLLMTHLYGLPCNIKEILKICKKNNILIIEDAAQACGAEYENKKVGSFGVLSYFSFGLYKNLNTLNGSMIISNNAKLDRKIRKIINNFHPPKKRDLQKNIFKTYLIYLATNKFIFSFLTYYLILLSNLLSTSIVYRIMNNKTETEFDSSYFLEKYQYSYTNFQAKIGLLQLKQLDLNNKKRIKNAQLLSKLLKKTNLQTIKINKKIKPIFLNLVIKNKKRNIIKKKLIKKGIDCSEGYLKSFSKNDCPESYKAENENLHIPVYPSLKCKDIRKIAENLM